MRLHGDGETLKQREAGQVEKVLAKQLRASLKGFSAKELLETTVAYEPVWPLGRVRWRPRRRRRTRMPSFARLWPSVPMKPTADKIRLQYGGSVKPDKRLRTHGAGGH
jgi:triosephosphate isomerase